MSASDDEFARGSSASDASCADDDGAGRVVAGEPVVHGRAAFTLPMGLVGRDLLQTVFTMDNWRALDDFEREYLRSLLPVGFQNDNEVARLFAGDSYDHGSPVRQLERRLAAGHYHPAVVRARKRVRYLEQRSRLFDMAEYHEAQTDHLLAVKRGRFAAENEDNVDPGEAQRLRSRRLVPTARMRPSAAKRVQTSSVHDVSLIPNGRATLGGLPLLPTRTLLHKFLPDEGPDETLDDEDACIDLLAGVEKTARVSTAAGSGAGGGADGDGDGGGADAGGSGAGGDGGGGGGGAAAAAAATEKEVKRKALSNKRSRLVHRRIFWHLVSYLLSEEAKEKNSTEDVVAHVEDKRVYEGENIRTGPMVAAALRFMRFPPRLPAGDGGSSAATEGQPIVRMRRAAANQQRWEAAEASVYTEAQLDALEQRFLDTMSANALKGVLIADSIGPRVQVSVAPTKPEIRAEFRRQELERHKAPEKAFTYRLDGIEYPVAPAARGGAPSHTKKGRAKHAIITETRPPSATWRSIVRDATARLPDGRGSRADVCILVRDSNFIVDDADDKELNSAVSTALDRLQRGSDPGVRYDPVQKVWFTIRPQPEGEK